MAVTPAQTGLLFDHAFRLHDPGGGHPECPERYLALSEALKKSGLLESLVRIPARMAAEEHLHLAHTRHYVSVVRADAARGARTLSTGDTALGESSIEVAGLAAGAGIAAVDAVCGGRLRNCFVAVRPPGHHATAARGMGFCVYNNVAIAARYARDAWGVDGILIIDWDVHHGNGTQDIFYEDPGVLFFSIHQWPWYPGTGAADETGAGAGEGTTINCPFPAGTGRGPVLEAFRRRLAPAANSFRPGLVMISAGFDSRRGDPLGRFTLGDRDFAEMTEIAMEIADKHCAGRIVSVLEGGYALQGLASATVAHLEALSGSAARRRPGPR